MKSNLQWLQGTGLQSSDFVRGELEEDCKCDACGRTKSKKMPRKIHSRKDRRNHDGEISTDLYGPFPAPTVEGSFFLQVYVRVGSGHLSVYGCARKNSCVENFSDYLKHWPPPLTTHYHADGAKELIGAEIKRLCEKFSPAIELTYSTAYSPNENSYAERAWRTLADMAHPNLVLSELPFRFIQKAMSFAAYVHNRLPRQTDKGWMSPHEYEFNEKPDLSRIRRWGCPVYYHVPSQLMRKGKIENGKRGYFMGFSKEQPYGWVCWDPKLNDFITSSNVVFVESIGEDLLKALSIKPKSSKAREIDLYIRDYSDENKSPEDYYHLVGKRYYDPDEREVFETTSIAVRGQCIIANRKKVIYGRTVGYESDNHPIFVRDVESMLSDRQYDTLLAAFTEAQQLPLAVQSVPDQGSPSRQPGPLLDLRAAHQNKEVRGCDSRREADGSVSLAELRGKASRGAGSSWTRVREALPKSIDSALLSDRFSRKWYAAMFNEIYYIDNEGKVWFEWKKALPPGVKPLGTRFVFKIKEKDDPEDDIFRARLVVQGFDQIFGVDYEETFSPTTKANILRLFLYFVLLFDMTLPIHLDAVKAYMNSDIDADIWVYPPKDPNEVFFKKGTVFKLKKALYGLKQAGRLWHKLVHEMLTKLGFSTLQSEPCFYYSVSGNTLSIVIIYVDDILITSQSSKMRDSLISKICQLYKFTNQGVVSEFLGIRIEFIIDNFNKFITLDQEKLITEKVLEFGLDKVKPSFIPMDPRAKLSTTDEPALPGTPYREMVGSALHVARWTRCDIANTVSQLSRFNSKPTRKSAVAAAQLWTYLRVTAHLKFILSISNVRKANFLMVGYSDSDWAGDLDSRRSTTGWMVFIGQTLINWIAQLQSFIAQSSMEAETIAANKLLNELLYLQKLFKEAGLLSESHSGNTIYIDNQSAIQAAKNPVSHGKTKHFDIQQYHLRENVNSGRVKLEKVPSAENPSDLLTKSLFRPTLEYHRNAVGIREIGKSAKRSTSDSDWTSSKEQRKI